MCMVFWVSCSREMFSAYLFHHIVTVYAYYYISVSRILNIVGVFPFKIIQTVLPIFNHV